MNRLLLSVLCATAIVGGVNSANAESKKEAVAKPGYHQEMHKVNSQRFAKELNLTDEQKEKAKEIREEGLKKMEPLKEDMTELRTKMDKVRQKNMKDFEEILTPEQKTKLEKIKADHLQKRAEKMKNKMKKHDKMKK